MAYERTAEQVKAEHIEKLGPELGSVFSELRNELAWLQLKWAEYRELFGTSPQRIDLVNAAAGHFFRIVQDTLWEDALLHLCRLTDPPTTGAKRNLTIQVLPDLCADSMLRDDLAAAVSEAVTAVAFARDWRNRRIGHRDLDLALHTSAEPLAPGSRSDVTTAIKAVHRVLNLIHERRLKSTLAEDVIGPNTGAEALLYVLRDGVDAAKARRNRFETGQRTQGDLRRDAV